jgi:hypothetical protein
VAIRHVNMTPATILATIRWIIVIEVYALVRIIPAHESLLVVKIPLLIITVMAITMVDLTIASMPVQAFTLVVGPNVARRDALTTVFHEVKKLVVTPVASVRI